MILVTGASGLLGSNFLCVASGFGRKVKGVYHRFPKEAPDETLLRADLTRRSEIENLVDSTRPTYIVHCAALTNVDWCESHPEEAWKVNVDASYWLAQAAQKYSAKLLFVSTDSIFDGKSGNYNEEDIPQPVNVYARTKLAAEEAVLECSPENLIIRTNIFGWNLQDKLSLAEWMLEKLESGSELLGFDDVIFSPILVNDLSKIILLAIDHDLTGIYHVAGLEALSKYDFAVEIAEIFLLDPKLIRASSINEISFPAARPLNTYLQTKKIQEALAITMPTIHSGIQAFKELRETGYVADLKTGFGG